MYKLFFLFTYFYFFVNAYSQNVKRTEKEVINEVRELYNLGKREISYSKLNLVKKNLKSPKAIDNANLLLAHYFNYKSLIDSSNYYAKKVLNNKEYESDSLSVRRKILVYQLLASNYKIEGLFEKSKRYYLRGLKETEKYNETDLYYYTLHGLGVIYLSLNNNKAIEVFKECLNYNKDQEIIFGSYINLGTIYAKEKKYNLSDSYFDLALNTVRDNKKYRKGVIEILLNKAINADQRGDNRQALKIYYKIDTLSLGNGFNKLRLINKINIAKSLKNNDQIEESKSILFNILSEIRELNYLNEELTVLSELIDLSAKEQRFKEAYNYFKTYNKLKDSITINQNVKDVKELEVKYYALKRKKEIENLRKEKELKDIELRKQNSIRKILVISFIVFLLPTIILLVVYYQKMNVQKKLNLKITEYNKKEKEFILIEQEAKLIKAGMEGQNRERIRIAREIHDSIGGNLAAIKLKIDDLNLRKIIDETDYHLRTLSHDLMKKKFSMNSFIGVLREYMYSISEDSNFDFKFEVYPKEDSFDIKENVKIEVFKIVQELIKNVIKHANASLLEFYINLYDGVLNIIFSDNGVGIKNKNNNKGIGLKNIESRLNNINGKLFIDSYKGTIITIEIKDVKKDTNEL